MTFMQRKILKRPRINRELSDIYRFPLTIIEAPAGYGKTTAVNGFFAEHEEKPLWISLRKWSDTTEYWAQFAAGISKLDRKVGKVLTDVGCPLTAPQRNRAVSVLNFADFSRPAIAVFDNYELLSDRQFDRFLLQAAEDEIENLHFVIITRDTTGIDFVPLLSKGKCCVISQQQIKFTAGEVADYCSLIYSGVVKADIDKITEYTDGWISMIYVLLLGAEENIQIGLNDTLEELIDKTLFIVHGVEVRRFLLRLSVMDSFSASQAAFVTENENAGEMLKSLQKKNAFIYYDGREKKYKIHPILMDFLRSKQDFSEAEQKELYRRLGEWHLGHNELLEAYSCLARAGDAKRILTHLNDIAPIRNRYTDFIGADELFSSVFRQTLFEYPIAYLRYLFYSVLKQKKPVIYDITHRLDDLETYYLKKQGIDESKRNRVLAEILCVRKFTAFNHLEEMHAYNGRIIGLLKGRQSCIMLNVNEFTFGSPHYLYIYFRDEGSLKKIAFVAQQNVHADFSGGCGTGSDALATAEYACETGDFDTAILESRKAVYRAETKSQWSVMICAKFNITRSALALGKIGTARETLRQLCIDAENTNSTIYDSMAQLCKGYVYSSAGMTGSIPQWLKDGDMSSVSMFFGGMGFDKLVYAKTLLADGEYLKLEALSDSFDRSFSIFQNRLGFLHNAILLAAAKYHLYGADEAAPTLLRALNMARPDEIVLPFAECAVHLLPVFKALPEEKMNGAFTSRVLLLCARYAENLKSILPEIPALTARETEVLKLLADGLSRKEIAERLVVSPATVKRHLEDVYRKLDADGKSAAVKAARINGLL